MPRLFSAYVIVDWSAASKPTTGADSVWIGVLKRDVRFRLAFESFNEATRAEAEKRLNLILADLKKRSERALVGFDFPMGFPRGFADALKLKGEPWRAAWDELGKRVVDKPTNVNNRFNVAAQLNRLLTDGPFPFWGAPPKDVQTTLTATKSHSHGPGDLPEFRHADPRRRRRRFHLENLLQWLRRRSGDHGNSRGASTENGARRRRQGLAIRDRL